MFRVSFQLFLKPRQGLIIFSCAVMLGLLAPAVANAQRVRGTTDPGDENQPAGTQFKGVRIGMTADETRKKLGSPKEKSAEQDFYIFNDNEIVQVYYAKSGVVSAISIDYMSGANSIPTSKDVLGSEAEAKTDGSIYKLVRFPKAGYWISYSRTAGNDATVTITMQKIQ